MLTPYSLKCKNLIPEQDGVQAYVNYAEAHGLSRVLGRIQWRHLQARSVTGTRKSRRVLPLKEDIDSMNIVTE